MTDADEVRLQNAAWSVCCDFHDDPVDILVHLKEWEAEYGRTNAGVLITAPAGWKLLPFRQVVPNSTHREYQDGVGWLQPRMGRSTMTPIWTRPSRYTRAFAVPELVDNPAGRAG